VVFGLGILVLIVSCTSISSVPVQTATTVSQQPAQVNATATEPVQESAAAAESRNTNAEQPAGGGAGDAAVISPQMTTPFVQLDQPAATFSISDANHTTPSDILREVSYSGGAGGGGYDCVPDTFSSGPIFNQRHPSEQPIEWMDYVLTDMCGWKDSNEVKLVVTSSHGQVIHEEKMSVSYGGIRNWFRVPINTPSGIYTLSFSSSKYSVSYDITVLAPTTPRLYAIEDKLVLLNFQPNELIRIFGYRVSRFDSLGQLRRDIHTFDVLSMQAWNQFQANDMGYLVLKLGEDTKNIEVFRAIGEHAGEIQPYPMGPYNVGRIFSPFNLTVIGPFTEDEFAVESIWTLAQFVDLKEPGLQTYHTAVSPDSQWRWGFSWCTVTKEQLSQISSGAFEFRVDGIPLDAQVTEYGETLSNGWECKKWVTLLTNWPPGEQVELEIRYTLQNAFFDGQETFPPGLYRQVIVVDVVP